MYGARLILWQEPAVLSLLPRSTWASRPYVIWIITYLLVIPALLFWLELSRGKLSRLLRFTLIAALAFGVAGVCSILLTGSPSGFMPYNKLLGIWTL